MSRNFKSLLLAALLPTFAVAGPVGLDGSIGADWTGVSAAQVGYDPLAMQGNETGCTHHPFAPSQRSLKVRVNGCGERQPEVARQCERHPRSVTLWVLSLGQMNTGGVLPQCGASGRNECGAFDTFGLQLFFWLPTRVVGLWVWGCRAGGPRSRHVPSSSLRLGHHAIADGVSSHCAETWGA